MPSVLGVCQPGIEGAWAESPEDDAALVRRAHVDCSAFGLLYDRYVDPVYRYCHRRLGTKEAAEDATAFVFTKALAALPAYRADGPSFRSWLFAIAHNVLADAGRCRQPTAAPLEAALTLAGAGEDPEAAALRSEAAATVRSLLAQLPADQRRLLELRLAGLSGAEIAAALGMSPGAVRVAHHRAVARLRALVDTGEEGADD